MEGVSCDAVVESLDSALGRWTAAQWEPPSESPLSAFVEHIWYFDGVLTHAKERVFPDGSAELVVMLDEPHRDGDVAAQPRFPLVCINGLRTRPSVVVAPAGRCRVVGLRLTPPGAARLVHSNMEHLVNVTVDVRDAVGSAAAELGERCAEAAETSASNASRNAIATIGAAVRWSLQHIDPGTSCDELVHWALESIRRRRGVISLDGLGGVLGITRPQFAQRFRVHTGVTPKRFARIVRFHHALALLGGNESIAGVAADLGYYDQAHMYRDFEEFAKMTPGAFLSAKRYPASVSLAEA
jgi:AraC-like DNA-binding protein